MRREYEIPDIADKMGFSVLAIAAAINYYRVPAAVITRIHKFNLRMDMSETLEITPVTPIRRKPKSYQHWKSRIEREADGPPIAPKDAAERAAVARIYEPKMALPARLAKYAGKGPIE